MRPRSLRGPAVAIALLAPAIAAAAVDDHHGSRFPFFTRLRDSALGWFYGRQPMRTSNAPYASFEAARYASELVLRFNVTSHDEEAALAAAVDRLFLDVWAFDGGSGFVDIRLQKDYVASLLKLLPPSLGQSFTPLIPDLAVAVASTYPNTSTWLGSFSRPALQDKKGSSALAGVEADNVFFEDYQPLHVIQSWMDLLSSMFSFVCKVNIGKSSEGRDILGLRVGKDCGDADRFDGKHARKTILIVGGLHAREWISTSTVAYMAWSLISATNKERLPTKMVEHFDIVFVPALNPDGYEYTWNTDRLWRKTRQHTGQEFCKGFDLDHAFGYEWDGAKPEPCSEIYGGDAAFEATEARALSSWVKDQMVNNHTQFISFFDMHSYAQEIMYPFSYSCKSDPSNLENLMELGMGIAKAIRIASNEPYTVMSACNGVVGRGQPSGPVPRIESGGGSAIDWFYHEIGARFSYQIKLRDTGNWGFVLPKDQIVPVGKEMWAALKYIGDYLLGNNGIEYVVKEEAGKSADAQALGGDDDFIELRKRQLPRRRR
jgi:extracellular matrix protein 14